MKAEASFGELTPKGLEKLSEVDEVQFVRRMFEEHAAITGSELAKRILEHWQSSTARFIKVLPTEYRRALARAAEGEKKAAAAEQWSAA